MHAALHPKNSELSLNNEARVFPPTILSGAMKLGPWETLVSRYSVEQTPKEHESVRELLLLWSCAFPRTIQKLGTEHTSTFAERYFGVPSLVVRVDYFHTGNSVTLCEIEEQPSGIALSSMVSSTFRKRMKQILESIEQASGKKLAIVISDRQRAASDDPFWAHGMFHRRVPVIYGMPTQDQRDKHLFLVRAHRDEVEYYALHEQSISTIALEGDKTYGLSMNLWKTIGNVDDLPWSSGVILKAHKGGRFEEALLAREGDSEPGWQTKSRACRAIAEGLVHYWQHFHEPEKPKFLNPRGQEHDIFMLRRAFWAFDPVTGKWTSLGGFWMANPSVCIHDSKTSLCGPLRPAQ